MTHDIKIVQERHGDNGVSYLWSVRTEPGDGKFAWQDIAQVIDYGDGTAHLHGYNVSSSDSKTNLLYMEAMGAVYPLAVAKYREITTKR